MNPRQGKRRRFQVETLEGRIALSSGPPLLVRGAAGHYVEVLQKDLQELGYGHDLGPFGVDGHFGQDTAQAVRHFQRDHHLKRVDGKVGPETWRALEGALAVLNRESHGG